MASRSPACPLTSPRRSAPFAAGRRRFCAALEPLETRVMLIADFTFANAVGSKDIHGLAVANDVAGNIYVTGAFQGTANFDPGSGTANLVSGGSHDLFLAKYSPAGGLIWAESFQGVTIGSVGQGNALVIDPSGNIYITGEFSGAVDFNPGPGTLTLNSPGRFDAFVAKLNANGGLVWAKDIPGSPNAVNCGFGIALDPSGNIGVTGRFQDTATFGATTLSAGPWSNVFAAKLDQQGNFLFATGTTGVGNANAGSTGLAIDKLGNMILSGFFSGTVNFRSGASGKTLTSSGIRDAFVEKLDGSGQVVWIVSVGGNDLVQANAVAVDPAGNIDTTGFFAGTVDFDPGPGTNLLTSGGDYSIFVSELDPAGRLVWARGMTISSNAASGTGIAVDSTGQVDTTGWFDGSVDFDPGPGTHLLTSRGFSDVFVSQLDNAGNFVGAQSAGGIDFDVAAGIALDGFGNMAIVGNDTAPASFGGTTLVSRGTKNAFVARIVKSTSIPPTPGSPQLEASSDTGLSSSDNITGAASPVFDVANAPSANTVELLRDGQVVGSRTGPGAIQDPGPVADGIRRYVARQRDLNGQVSLLSPSLAVTMDTTPPPTPPAPTLLAADDSGTKSDVITIVRRPHLVGSAEPLALILLVDSGGTSLGTSTALADGTYSIQPATGLANGTYQLRIKAQDAAGNMAASPALTLTIVSSSLLTTPVLLPADDSNVVGDGITNVRQPRLIGTADAGMILQLEDGGGLVLGRTTVNADGSYSVSFAAVLGDGTYSLHLRESDSEGYLLGMSAVLSLTIDPTPPATPAAPALLPTDDTGTKGDGITVVRRPRLNGVAEPGGIVNLLDNAGHLLGSAPAGPDGSYVIQYPVNLSNGHVFLQVRESDAAGNMSQLGATFNLTTTTVAGDYDGDGRADVAVFRPTTDQWLILGSQSGGQVLQFGAPNSDIPIPGDYDGIGRTELAVFRTATAQWLIWGPSGLRVVQFGGPGDIPVPGDYDGDGKIDIAVFRPGTAQWFILRSSAGGQVVQFGAPGLDKPVPADYDGDGKADLAVFRANTAQWLILRSTAGPQVVSFGAANLDQPVPADYDGDGKADLAVFRPNTAQWLILRSTAGGQVVSFGAGNLDIALPADYDGDGKTDIAVFRPTTAQWLILRSRDGPLAQPFGAAGLDVPLTSSLAYRTQASLGSPSVLLRQISSRSESSFVARSLSFDANRRVEDPLLVIPPRSPGESSPSLGEDGALAPTGQKPRGSGATRIAALYASSTNPLGITVR